MSVFEKFIDYLRSSKDEARKVSWPSRQDTLRYSALVVGVSLIVAVFFAILDFGFTKLVDVALLQRVVQPSAQDSQALIQPDITTSSTAVTVPTPANQTTSSKRAIK